MPGNAASVRTRKTVVAGGVVLAHVAVIFAVLLVRHSAADEDAIADSFVTMPLHLSAERAMSPLLAVPKAQAPRLQMLAPELRDIPVELDIQMPEAPPIESSMPAEVSPPSAPVTAQADVGLAGDASDSSGQAGAGDGLVLLQRAMPGYPPQAQRQGQQGVTTVLLHITESGRVDDVKVEQGSGSRLLDKAAVDAFRKWRFQRLPAGSAPRGRWLRTAQRFVLYAFTFSRLDPDALNSVYAEHLKPKPGTDVEATPGVQEALARFIASVRGGTYAIPAGKVQAAFEELRATLEKWGEVKSIRFGGLAGSSRWTTHWSGPLAGVPRQTVEVSWSMFEVHHENAISEWLIAVGHDGSVWAVRAGQAPWK